MLDWRLTELQNYTRIEQASKISRAYKNGFNECTYYLPIKPAGSMKVLITKFKLFTNDKPQS